jgi:hypothetical protein
MRSGFYPAAHKDPPGKSYKSYKNYIIYYEKKQAGKRCIKGMESHITKPPSSGEICQLSSDIAQKIVSGLLIHPG